MTVAKDTVRPPVPVATPGGGAFKTSPVSVSLDSPVGDTDTKAIRYRLGATPATTGEPTSTSNLWNGTQISISSTQTLKAAAFDAVGNQSPTLAQTYTIDSTAPTAPGNLTLTPGDRKVDLVWDAATDNSGVVGYNVYRRLTSGAFSSPVNGGTPVTTTSFTNSGLTNGTTYVFAVTAVDAAGNESLKSLEDQATPNPAALAAPGLSPATAGDGKVDLSWTPVAGATTYNVYRATTATGTPTKIGSPTPATGTTFTDSTASNGTTYFYVVRAVNSAGVESTDSNQVSATPKAAPPAAVTGLTATAGDAKVDLNWTAVSGATSYNVYRSTTSGTFTAADKVNNAPVTASSFTSSGLTNGTQYFFIVRAVNAGGESPDSAEVTATPKAAPVGAPTGVTATAGNAKVDLNWTAVTGATGYNVYRSTTSGAFTAADKVNSAPVTASSFRDTGVTNGTRYFYVVRSVNAGGESGNSAEVSATPVAPPPAAPTGLTATAGDAKVDLSWTAVSGATTYNVYRATGAGALARMGSRAARRRRPGRRSPTRPQSTARRTRTPCARSTPTASRRTRPR
jgi:fibronectin type 3 domain-containing protein